ncbi:hypothetical protein ACP70R_007443 [Stipagrostis hirtigluma subsp. patula]
MDPGAGTAGEVFDGRPQKAPKLDSGSGTKTPAEAEPPPASL